MPNAGRILVADYYGWFERVARGTYGLTPAGQAMLAALEARESRGRAGGRGLEHPRIGQEPGRVDERRVAAQELVVVDDVEPGLEQERERRVRPEQAGLDAAAAGGPGEAGEDRRHGVRAGRTSSRFSARVGVTCFARA